MHGANNTVATDTRQQARKVGPRARRYYMSILRYFTPLRAWSRTGVS